MTLEDFDKNAKEARIDAEAKIKTVLRACGVAASYLAHPRKDHVFSVEALGKISLEAILNPISWASVEDLRLEALRDLDLRLKEACEVRR
jgi:hypothetical protein